jgi:hypothetical protein
LSSGQLGAYPQALSIGSGVGHTSIQPGVLLGKGSQQFAGLPRTSGWTLASRFRHRHSRARTARPGVIGRPSTRLCSRRSCATWRSPTPPKTAPTPSPGCPTGGTPPSRPSHATPRGSPTIHWRSWILGGTDQRGRPDHTRPEPGHRAVHRLVRFPPPARPGAKLRLRGRVSRRDQPVHPDPDQPDRGPTQVEPVEQLPRLGVDHPPDVGRKG